MFEMPAAESVKSKPESIRGTLRLQPPPSYSPSPTPCSTALNSMSAYHAVPSSEAHCATNQDFAIEGAAEQLSRSSPRGPSAAEDVL